MIKSFSQGNNFGAASPNLLTLRGTAGLQSVVSLFDDNSLVGSVEANYAGLWSLCTNGTLADGTHRFTAIATNADGDSSVASPPLTIFIDAQDPSLTKITSRSSDAGNFADSGTISALLAGFSNAGGIVNLLAEDLVLGAIGFLGVGGVRNSASLSALVPEGLVQSLSAIGHAPVGTAVAGDDAGLDGTRGLNAPRPVNSANSAATGGEGPALTVNAANAAAVAFAVSGLQSDYSGTVTFTNSTGKSDVVAIDGNGTYSANL